MTPTEIRVRFRRAGGHTDITFWTGCPGFTFGNVGTLTMREQDEELFRNALLKITPVHVIEDYRMEESDV
jgi:hypothetical protein